MRFSIAIGLLFFVASPAIAEDVVSAEYAAPTTRYAHGVLGDAIEHGSLVMETAGGRRFRVDLPERRVFEDTEPRLFDVDGDGQREVIVVESDMELGARLAIYGPEGLVASNEFIGRSSRWLAPVGLAAADLDGDGSVELAFVDRPHLAKTLRIFRFEPETLVLVGEYPGVTNHRIGERDIAGGIRDCGAGPEMIVADASWRRILAITFDGVGFQTSDLGEHKDRASFNSALNCQD